MRTVDAHLLEDKMDDTVTHYIHSHPGNEPVHMNPAGMPLNVQDDGGSRVTIMHSQNFSSPLCRQVSVGEQVGDGPWGEELLDPDGRIAAIVAQLAQQSRTAHHQHQPMHKSAVRSEVDQSVILDGSMRLFNGPTLDPPQEPIVVHVPHLPTLPPLQEMKRCQDTDWFNNKSKGVSVLKDNSPILAESESPVLELGACGSPAHNKHQSKKSLPHKKRISRKLKRNTGNSTPQQDIVVISCNEEVPHEEILPDNFVTGMQHQEQLSEDTHHITHEVRPILLCQLCGEFYGEEQVKFYHHLKQHYEPHSTIIIDNSVADMPLDKMTNTCIVDNVPSLPDSIVELSLEKSMYQSIDKHILYTSSEKSLNYANNKVQYTMASMDKEPVVCSEPEKSDLYDSLDRLELYNCVKCNKSFRRQRQCEAHIREAHSNPKLEDMGEFSEPEDLMEGIHVTVDVGADHYEHTLLVPPHPHSHSHSHPHAHPHAHPHHTSPQPHPQSHPQAHPPPPPPAQAHGHTHPLLTVENGHVHQDHVRWYLRGGNAGNEQMSSCAGEDAYCAMCPSASPVREQTHETETHEPQPLKILKEEVLQRILETEVTNEQIITDNIMPDNETAPEPELESESEPPPEASKERKKKSQGQKKFECPQCGLVFQHKSSLLYHVLTHGGKQHICRECGKGFYTTGALKIHKRVHNGDRPYKCDVCGRDFRQWSDLKYHKAIHSNQKRFKCEFCEKEFARKYSLSVHRRIHTGERNYPCAYCGKSFRASSYRLSHMRTHTGDRPHKCEQCNKCFRVAFDLRRHILTHEKARLKYEQQKAKVKKEMDRDQEQDPLKDAELPTKTKKIAVASTTKQSAILKKQKPIKKTTKKGAPNVTVTQNSGQFKHNSEYTNNVEVFDTRQTYVKHNDRGGGEDRNLALLKPMYRGEGHDTEKSMYTKPENTDGKMQIYTHVEKNKEYNSIVPNTQIPLNDIRHNEREVGREVNGEGIENGFFERLTALYNIPAV